VSELNMDDDAAMEAAMEAEDREHGKQAEPKAEEAEEQVEAQAEAEPEAEATEVAAEAATEPEPEAEPAKPAGVASKDGKAVLPYAALKGARAETRREREMRAQVEAERDALKQQLEQLKAGKSEPEVDPLAELVDDFPAAKALVDEVRALRAQVQVKATPTAPTAAAAAAAVDADDPVQEAIDSVPLLAGWQAADPEKWARATALDNAIKGSPKWQSKSLEERFAHVAKLVADEFDIQTPEPASQAKPTKARQDPDAVVQGAKRTAPNTLSDFKGGSSDSSQASIDRLSPRAMTSRAMDMTDDEIDRWLAKVG
jgi:hypothetical protein